MRQRMIGTRSRKADPKNMSRLIAIANEFILRAQAHDVEDLNPGKLHDMVYLAQGWRIGSAGQMAYESPAMAHHDGVFLKELREQGCWGTKRIASRIEIFGPGPDGMLAQSIPTIVPGDPVLVTLDYVWVQYGRMTPFETAQATREAGGPWDQIWNDAARDNDQAREIPLEVIRKWFWAQFKLRAVAGVSKAAVRVRRDEEDDEHNSATELHHLPDKDNLRSA
jgi:uncharacterized phage-associated protein